MERAGHMTVAAIAYQLSEPVRSKVDTLLQQHPDFELLSEGIPSDDPNFGLRVFMRAATWPNLIGSDMRFVEGDEPQPGDPPPLPGFPHMLRGRNCFINVPFSTDGTALQPPRPINALAKIVEFRTALRDPSVAANIQAYDLGWLLHLVGDIHQPLHAVARFTTQHPAGDRGGNDFKIQGTPDNLHSLDDLLGSGESTQSVLTLADGITTEMQSRNPEEIGIPAAAAPEAVIRSWD
jgi:S1/P1 nuclease